MDSGLYIAVCWCFVVFNRAAFDPDALALEFADVLDAERELPAEGFWDSGLSVAVCWCFAVFNKVAF